MELRNLITFLQVVESESFTKAAEILGYTQSAVSTQIHQLEQELGCRLFDRINHAVSLTEMGRQLQQHALRVDHAILELKDSFRKEQDPSGVVRIVSSDSICEKMMLLNYLNFYKTYPGIKLVFSTANTDEMFQRLINHEADVMFSLDSHVVHRNFVIAREAPVQLHFVTSAGSPLAGAKDLDIRELLNYPFMLTEKGMSYRKVLDEWLAQMSLQIDPVLEAGRTDVLAYCLEKGNAISLLPDFVTEKQVNEGRLVYLDVKNFDLQIWKQLIYHKDKWISGTLSAFLEFVMGHEFEW